MKEIILEALAALSIPVLLAAILFGGHALGY